MDELRELYQQVILDHNKNPKNFHIIEPASHTSEGYNPLCGDRITIYLKVEDDVIMDIGFQGSGCAISKASASLMTTAVKGKTIQEAEELFNKFHNLLTGDRETSADIPGLRKLIVFTGVREFPSRIKCAALAWHTLIAALKNEQDTVSTE